MFNGNYVPINPVLRHTFPHEKKQQQQKVAPSQFLKKIPNRRVLLDFFCNQCKLYCPPFRDLNKQFAADILQEKKFLLFQNQVNRVERTPNIRDLSTKNIWQSLRQKKEHKHMLLYFPDYKGNVYPNKSYMMNVINVIFNLISF